MLINHFSTTQVLKHWNMFWHLPFVLHLIKFEMKQTRQDSQCYFKGSDKNVALTILESH